MKEWHRTLVLLFVIVTMVALLLFLRHQNDANFINTLGS